MGWVKREVSRLLRASFSRRSALRGLAAFSTGATLLAVATLLASSAGAQQAEEPFFRDVIVDMRVITPELIEQRFDETIRINAQPLIANFSSYTIPINENFFDVVSLDAETIKKDGTRIKVQPDKILVATQPNAPALGFFFADVRTRTIVYPDVQPGDSIHHTMVVRQKRPYLTGGISPGFMVQPNTRHRSFVWRLEGPKDIDYKVSTRHFTVADRTDGDTRRLTFTLERQPFRAEEPLAVSPWDRAPMARVSTFANKAAIAQAFYDGAAPKAQPNDEIRALAAEITKGISDKREQARAIHGYVARNIRYMAILLGNGGWVPHEASEILRLKYGDCKDHVTLMRALLSAVGIEAEYALINSAPVYQTHRAPVYHYDHVILYLPAFDLYTDPTSHYSSFDFLPQGQADKEVLRVGAKGVVETRSPRLDAGTNRLRLTTDVTLRDNGTPIGKTVAEATGPVARELRALAGEVAKVGGAEFANTRLKARRWRGTGDVIAPTANDLTDPYRLTTTFDLANRYFGDGANRNILPFGPNLIEPFAQRVRVYLRQNRTQDFPCYAQSYEHVFKVTLPAGKELATVPANVETVTDLLRFTARYRLDGQILHVERRLVSTLPGQVCTAAMARAMEPVVRAFMRDLTTRLHFKGDAAAGTVGDGDDPL